MAIRTHTDFDASLRLENGLSMAQNKSALSCEVIFNASNFESYHAFCNYMNNAGSSSTCMFSATTTDGIVGVIAEPSFGGFEIFANSPPNSYNMNELVHATMSLNFATQTIIVCVNGVEVLNVFDPNLPTASPSAQSSVVRIHASRTSNGGNMIGTMYQLRLFDTEIDEERSAELYKRTVLQGGKGSLDVNGLMFDSKFMNEDEGVIPAQTAGAYADFTGKEKYQRDNNSTNIEFAPNIF